MFGDGWTLKGNNMRAKDDLCLVGSSLGKHLGHEETSLLVDSVESSSLGSSLTRTNSHSCPKLTDLDTSSGEGPKPADTWAIKVRNLKSHPVAEEDKKKKKAKRKGITLGKLFSVVSLGLGSTIYYFGWKWRFIRFCPSVIGGFCVGTYAGLKFCRKYQRNKAVKHWNREILSLPLSENGSFQLGATQDIRKTKNMNSASEKVEYLTRVLKQMWPFYEPNICKWIVGFLTPTLEESKPHIIRHIHFSRLTFGSIPFDITEVRVVEENDDEFIIDAGIRWHGNAHVAMAIDLRGGGVLRPKFEKFNFRGTARINFTPLIDKFPGFGAMTLCLRSTPIIDFKLSMDQSVLSLVAEQVQHFLSAFVTDHVFGNVLVWPARLVIPVLPEGQRGKLDHLHLHTRGVLRVLVVEATGLAFGERCNGFMTHIKPFVVLETVALQPLTTKVLPDGQLPIWNEELFLKVQELDQNLRVEIFDDHYDPVVSAFSRLKRHGRKIGSVSIPLKDLEAGKSIDKWHSLTGIDENSNRVVRSKHHGQDLLSEMWYVDKSFNSKIQIRLCMTYMPVEDLRQGKLFLNRGPTKTSSRSHHGLLFIRLVRAYNLANVDYLSLSDPFCQLTVGSRPLKRSRTMKNTLDPKWGESFEWYNVSVKDKLCIEVLSEGRVVDTLLGFVSVELRAIAIACERDTKVIDTTFTLTEGIGDIHLEMEWVPLDNKSARKRGAGNHVNMRGLGLRAPPRGQLFLRLLWATGLENVDYIGYSDPYCILKVQGSEHKSRVIWDNLNPKWEEEFWWESVKHTDVLEIEVWDRGTLQDTFLASLEVTINEALDREGVIREHSRPLIKKDGSQHGILTFQILWTLSEGQRRSASTSAFVSWPNPRASPPPANARRSFGSYFLSA